MALTRVCVIGAGSSGIAVVKALKDAAIDFDCFDVCSVVGGNWAFGSAWSAAYRTLHINSYCREMQYADFPMPADVSDYPHHEEIAAYFNDYVDHFGLRRHITFDTAVERAEPKGGGNWSVRLSTGETRQYSYLIVATGHHHTPRWPEPPFPGHFDGLQMHSHDYRDMAQLSGKDVVVLGMGNSAMDIAVESSYVAQHTYLASRRGAYVIPKYFFGRPGLAIPPWLPWQVRQAVLQQAVRVTVGPVERYGLPRPAHRILQAHPTVSDGLLSRIAHGAIVPKPNIAELCGEKIRFADGTEAAANVIVYCTGYRIQFPFFDQSVVNPDDNELPLYARIFPLAPAGLAFVGFVQPWGSIMPAAEAQAKLVADLLVGRYALPEMGAMRRATMKDRRATARRYVASKRHTIQIDMPQYLWALRREHERGKQRAMPAAVDNRRQEREDARQS
jgi:dimethylaniline monooxygenase (N-oxide forming)